MSLKNIILEAYSGNEEITESTYDKSKLKDLYKSIKNKDYFETTVGELFELTKHLKNVNFRDKSIEILSNKKFHKISIENQNKGKWQFRCGQENESTSALKDWKLFDKKGGMDWATEVVEIIHDTKNSVMESNDEDDVVTESVDKKLITSLESELEQTKLVWKTDKKGFGEKHIKAIELQLELAKKGWSESKIVNLGINSRNFEKFEKHLNESNDEEVNESLSRETLNAIEHFKNVYERVLKVWGNDSKGAKYVEKAKKQLEMAKAGKSTKEIFAINE